MSTLSIAPAFHTGDRIRAVRPARAPRPSSACQARPVQQVRRAPAAQTSSLRLTRRGRLTLFLGTLAVALTASFFLGAGAVGTEEAGTPVATEIVMVGTGDTLWGIASDAADGGDVRDVMTEIERLNALESPGLMAGQKLRVPVASE